MALKAFEDYSSHIRSTWKEILLEYFVPLIAEFVILFISVAAFMQCVKLGPMVQEPVMFARQMTKPTVGRLAYGILGLILWLVFSFAASKAAGHRRRIRIPGGGALLPYNRGKT